MFQSIDVGADMIAQYRHRTGRQRCHAMLGGADAFGELLPIFVHEQHRTYHARENIHLHTIPYSRRFAGPFSGARKCQNRFTSFRGCGRCPKAYLLTIRLSSLQFRKLGQSGTSLGGSKG